MTTQKTARKNIKLILIALAAVAVVGLFAAKLVVENKIRAWATEDLSLYEPLLKLESAKVSASWFGAGVTYKNVVYSLPDVPGLTMVVDEMAGSGIDRNTLMGKAGEITTIDKIGLRGLRVLLEGYEAPVLEVGYYEETDVSFPYRDMRAALLAGKGAENPLPTMQAILSIAGQFPMRSGPSRVNDFKMNLRQFDLPDISMGLFTASGFRELAREADGFDGAVDNIAYKNLTLSGPLPNGSELLASLDSLEFKGLKFNYRELLEALTSFNEGSDPIDLLLAVLPSLYNYAFDGMSASNFSLNARGALFTLDKISLGPRSLKAQGPNSASNMKLVMNGMNVFTLESLGFDEFVLPDALVDFINNPAEYINNAQLMLEFYERPLVPLYGTLLKNMHLRNLDVPGLVKLGNWSSDIVFEETVTFTSRLEALNVSNIGLRQASMALSSPGDASLREAIEVLAMNGGDLTLDSNLELEFGLDGRSIVYSLGFDMAALEQGALNFEISGMTDEPQGFYQAFGAPLFFDMLISVEDKGFLQNTLKYLAAQGLAPDAESVRNALALELEQGLAEAGPSEATLIQGLKSFLLQGGKLSVAFQPSHPTLLDGGRAFEDLENMNLSVSHSK